MPSIAETIRQFREGAVAGAASTSSARLQRLTAFGSNPGALTGWFHVPDAGRDMALVVVLHGCTQTAAGYDRGSGWSDLAERFGFAVLFPEQGRANNPNLCFNWFLEEDTRRDGGEALSIRQMVAALVREHGIDPRRVFVTGLSAGGAMANVMLATYPEVFAGGAIIAGLPFGATASVTQAMERMRGAGHADGATDAKRVRAASRHRGRWPTISVWHGDADRTVDVTNADAIVAQWAGVHGVGGAPDRIEAVDGRRRQVWLGQDGRVVLEHYRIAGLGHGAPLKTSGPDSCGVVSPYMLEAGISSTWRQAESWGLLGAPSQAAARVSEKSPDQPPLQAVSPVSPASSLTAAIEGALRSAGLME